MVVVVAVMVEKLVVMGKVVVVTVVVVRPAAVVLVVVVGSGKSVAIRPAQTKYELSFILAGMRAQVSILKKCSQTQRSRL